MIDEYSIKKILGIENDFDLYPSDMAKKLTIVFWPSQNKVGGDVERFASKLLKSFNSIGVKVIGIDEAWEEVSLLKRLDRFFRYVFNNLIWLIHKILHMNQTHVFMPFNVIIRISSSRRLKSGVSVVCVGEQPVRDLAMQYIRNFKTNSVITILPFPSKISEGSNFIEHFNVAMDLFAFHMTNIVIGVDNKKWILYNFNAAHPIYSQDDVKFDSQILSSLIPKIAAPISPQVLRDFSIIENGFNPAAEPYSKMIESLMRAGNFFEKRNLYPPGKKIDDLPFRDPFHKVIGKMHLDLRNGMSYGFLAHQVPISVPTPLNFIEFKKTYPKAFLESTFFVSEKNEYYILVKLDQSIVIKIPEIWVLSLRSGANKVKFDVDKDLIKIGLINGKLYIQTPEKMKMDIRYRPSFDTRVILSHALGNFIVCSIMKYLNYNSNFSRAIENSGIPISHWHGYFNKEMIPKFTLMYGIDNPHVSCSTPQSAFFALNGKLNKFISSLQEIRTSNYHGDIHIEPHHGINVCYYSLNELCSFIEKNPESTALGNKYLS